MNTQKIYNSGAPRNTSLDTKVGNPAGPGRLPRASTRAWAAENTDSGDRSTVASAPGTDRLACEGVREGRVGDPFSPSPPLVAMGKIPRGTHPPPLTASAGVWTSSQTSLGGGRRGVPDFPLSPRPRIALGQKNLTSREFAKKKPEGGGGGVKPSTFRVISPCPQEAFIFQFGAARALSKYQ